MHMAGDEARGAARGDAVEQEVAPGKRQAEVEEQVQHSRCSIAGAA